MKIDTRAFELEFLTRAKHIAFIVFLFTVPIFLLFDAGRVRLYQESYFQGMALFVGSLYFRNIWLTLFMWLNLALFVWHGSSVGAHQVLNIFLSCVLFACARTFFSKHSFGLAAKTLYWVAFLSLIMMVFQMYGIDPYTTVTDLRTGEPLHNTTTTLKSGLFFLPPFNAIFLTLTAPFLLFMGRWKWIGLLLIFGAIDARCSAAFLAWAFLIPFWTYWRGPRVPIYLPSIKRPFYFLWGKKRLFIPVLIIIGLGMSYYTYKDFRDDTLTYTSRFESWHMMLRHSGRNLLGWGPDSFRNYNKHKNFIFKSDRDYQPIFSQRPDPNTEVMRYHSANPGLWDERFKGRMPDISRVVTWGEAHNDYLQFLFEYGIIGLVLLWFFGRELLERFKVSKKTDEILALFACLMVYALVATTQFPFHLARLSGMFGIILGAFWGGTDKYYLKTREVTNEN